MAIHTAEVQESDYDIDLAFRGNCTNCKWHGPWRYPVFGQGADALSMVARRDAEFHVSVAR